MLYNVADTILTKGADQALISVIWTPNLAALVPHVVTPRSLVDTPRSEPPSQFVHLVVMVVIHTFLFSVWVAITTVFVSPSTDSTCPVVVLDKGTFVGKTANGTNKFLGIPFARPPSVLDLCSKSTSSLTDPPN